MPLSAGRRFRLVDAILLIAGTAIGFAWTRETFQRDWAELLALGNVETSFLVQALWWWSDLAVPCLTTWTITLALLWLRPPRKSVREMSGYPGAVACAAVTASLFVNVAFNVVFYLFVSVLPGGHSEWFFWIPHLLAHTIDDLGRYSRPRGEAIAICWLFLLMSRRWENQPTWLDRLSRVVAVLWLIAGVPWYFFPIGHPGQPLM